jgi:hypothetical protein
MLNKSREDKDCGICYPDSTVFIPFTLIWHSMEYVIRYRVVSLTLINLYLSYWFIYEHILERSDCSDDGVDRE